MNERTINRVSRTAGALYSEPRKAAKRRTCDGHLSERHHIEEGSTIIWCALPPHSELGNERWWHLAFCEECAPAAVPGGES